MSLSTPHTCANAIWRRCPVNVHWHLGAEHKNEGTFDQHPPAGLVHNTGRRLAEAHHAPEAGHWCPKVTDAGSSITL